MAVVTQYLLPESAQFLASTFPGTSKVNGTNFPVFSLAYDTTTVERAYWHFNAVNYGSGDITCTVYWYADTASSGGVTWETALAAITPNTDSQDVETKSFATVNTAADTHLGTTGQRLHGIAVTITNTDSVANGDECWLRVSRLTTDGGDTMAGDALLVGIKLEYSD